LEVVLRQECAVDVRHFLDDQVRKFHIRFRLRAALNLLQREVLADLGEMQDGPLAVGEADYNEREPLERFPHKQSDGNVSRSDKRS
jgi:hypothetical protein